MSKVPVKDRRTVKEHECTCIHQGTCKRHPDGPTWGDAPLTGITPRLWQMSTTPEMKRPDIERLIGHIKDSQGEVPDE